MMLARRNWQSHYAVRLQDHALIGSQVALNCAYLGASGFGGGLVTVCSFAWIMVPLIM